MKEVAKPNRYFQVRDRPVCRITMEDGRTAMMALDKDNCLFVVESFYFNIFFQHSDLPYIEMDENTFREAVIKQCGFYPAPDIIR